MRPVNISSVAVFVVEDNCSLRGSTLLVKISSDEGDSGWGAFEGPAVVGLAWLASRVLGSGQSAAEYLEGRTLSSAADVLKLSQNILASQRLPANVWAACDAALWALLAKANDQALWDILHIAPSAKPIVYTPPEGSGSAASSFEEACRHGYHWFHLGPDASDTDISAACQAIGEHGTLLVSAPAHETASAALAGLKTRIVFITPENTITSVAQATSLFAKSGSSHSTQHRTEKGPGPRSLFFVDVDSVGGLSTLFRISSLAKEHDCGLINLPKPTPFAMLTASHALCLFPELPLFGFQPSTASETAESLLLPPWCSLQQRTVQAFHTPVLAPLTDAGLGFAIAEDVVRLCIHPVLLQVDATSTLYLQTPLSDPVRLVRRSASARNSSREHSKDSAPVRSPFGSLRRSLRAFVRRAPVRRKSNAPDADLGAHQAGDSPAHTPDTTPDTHGPTLEATQSTPAKAHFQAGAEGPVAKADHDQDARRESSFASLLAPSRPACYSPSCGLSASPCYAPGCALAALPLRLATLATHPGDFSAFLVSDREGRGARAASTFGDITAGEVVVSVNRRRLWQLPHRETVMHLNLATPPLTLVLAPRGLPLMRSVYLISGENGFGFTFKARKLGDGAVISKVRQGSPAAASGMVHEGDIMVEIDGINVQSASYEAIHRMLIGASSVRLRLQSQDDRQHQSFARRVMRVLRRPSSVAALFSRTGSDTERTESFAEARDGTSIGISTPSSSRSALPCPSSPTLSATGTEIDSPSASRAQSAQSVLSPMAASAAAVDARQAGTVTNARAAAAAGADRSRPRKRRGPIYVEGHSVPPLVAHAEQALGAQSTPPGIPIPAGQRSGQRRRPGRNLGVFGDKTVCTLGRLRPDDGGEPLSAFGLVLTSVRAEDGPQLVVEQVAEELSATLSTEVPHPRDIVVEIQGQSVVDSIPVELASSLRTLSSVTLVCAAPCGLESSESVISLTVAASEHEGLGLRVKSTSQGPVITGVTPGSPAAESNVRAGDVVLSIGETEVGSLASHDSVIELLRSTPRPLRLTLRRGSAAFPAIAKEIMATPSLTASSEAVLLSDHRDGPAHDRLASSPLVERAKAADMSPPLLQETTTASSSDHPTAVRVELERADAVEGFTRQISGELGPGAPSLPSSPPTPHSAIIDASSQALPSALVHANSEGSHAGFPSPDPLTASGTPALRRLCSDGFKRAVTQSAGRTPSAPRVLGLALIGCGQAAAPYIQAIREMQETGFQLAVTVVIDPIPERALAAARALASNPGVCSSLAEALSTIPTAFNAVLVLVPSALHSTIATEALQASKHVLVERPAATSLEALFDLILAADRAETHGIHAMAAANAEYWLEPQQALRLVGENTIGPVCHTRATAQRPSAIKEPSLHGAPLPTQAWFFDQLVQHTSHHIRLLRHLHGEVDGVVALSSFETEAEAPLSVLLKFRNGTHAQLSLLASRLFTDMPLLHIVGATGEITVTSKDGDAAVRVITNALTTENRLLLPDGGLAQSVKLQLAAFYNWVINGVPAAATVAAAAEDVKVLLAIARALVSRSWTPLGPPASAV